LPVRIAMAYWLILPKMLKKTEFGMLGRKQLHHFVAGN